jgi:ketosteroid isomerase-like protein
MSTNLDIVRKTYSMGPDAFLETLSPDVEWTEAAGFPYAGTYRGVSEIVRNVFVRLATEWEGFRADMETLHDAGDTIVATGFYRGTYRSTSRSMKASFAHVLTLKDGKIVRFVQYVDSKMVWEAMVSESAARRELARE